MWFVNPTNHPSKDWSVLFLLSPVIVWSLQALITKILTCFFSAGRSEGYVLISERPSPQHQSYRSATRGRFAHLYNCVSEGIKCMFLLQRGFILWMNVWFSFHWVLQLSGTGEFHVDRTYEDFEWLQQHLYSMEDVPGIQGVIVRPLLASADPIL